MLTSHHAVYLLIALSIIAANLPFVSQRVLCLYRSKAQKSFFIRLLELCVYYFAVGGCGYLLENHLGQAVAQGWEFFAITTALFLTLAFPGFVYRYLVKPRTAQPSPNDAEPSAPITPISSTD